MFLCCFLWQVPGLGCPLGAGGVSVGLTPLTPTVNLSPCVIYRSHHPHSRGKRPRCCKCKPRWLGRGCEKVPQGTGWGRRAAPPVPRAPHSPSNPAPPQQRCLSRGEFQCKSYFNPAVTQGSHTMTHGGARAVLNMRQVPREGEGWCFTLQNELPFFSAA